MQAFILSPESSPIFDSHEALVILDQFEEDKGLGKSAAVVTGVEQ